MDHERFNQLISQYLETQLSSEEKAELEQVLLSSAEARQLFWREISLHGLLWESCHPPGSLPLIASPNESNPDNTVAADANPAEEQQEVEMDRPETAASNRPCRPRPGRWWLRPPWIWGAASACGVAVLAGLLLLVVLPQFQPLATVSLSIDAQGTGPTPSFAFNLGSGLTQGDFQLDAGAVELEFANGAQVVFEAPASFTLESQRNVFCRQGRFWTHVPPKARGFTLASHDLKAVDLGTEFGLIASPQTASAVHVFEGSVTVQDTASVLPVATLTNQEAVVSSTGAWERIAADADQFLSADELAQRELPAVKQRQFIWNEHRTRLSQDPGAILHLPLVTDSPGANTVANQAASGISGSRATVMGCTWTEGRWPGKKALAFQNPQDRLRLYLPQSFTAFTSFIWLRVDGLPNTFVHSMMTADSEKPGSLRWTISHEGQIRFGLANASPGSEAAWAVGISPKVITQERLGQWLLIALTFDGQQATHYVNGEAVWTGRMNGPQNLSFGWVEVGNWTAHSDHPDFAWAKNRGAHFFTRRFVGAMDEIGVLQRVMPAEEIKAYYEAGRPVDLPAPARTAAAEKD